MRNTNTEVQERCLLIAATDSKMRAFKLGRICKIQCGDHGISSSIEVHVFQKIKTGDLTRIRTNLEKAALVYKKVIRPSLLVISVTDLFTEGAVKILQTEEVREAAAKALEFLGEQITNTDISSERLQESLLTVKDHLENISGKIDWFWTFFAALARQTDHLKLIEKKDQTLAGMMVCLVEGSQPQTFLNGYAKELQKKLKNLDLDNETKIRVSKEFHNEIEKLSSKISEGSYAVLITCGVVEFPLIEKIISREGATIIDKPQIGIPFPRKSWKTTVPLLEQMFPA